jgi:hypothetical protein
VPMASLSQGPVAMASMLQGSTSMGPMSMGDGAAMEPTPQGTVAYYPQWQPMGMPMAPYGYQNAPIGYVSQRQDEYVQQQWYPQQQAQYLSRDGRRDEGFPPVGRRDALGPAPVSVLS